MSPPPLHKPYKLAIAAALVLTCLLAFLMATEKSRLSEATQSRSSEMVEQGAHLYLENCRTCHGVKGEGVGQLGPALNSADFFTARKKEVGWNGTLQEYIIATTEYGRLMGTRPMYAGNGSTAVMPPWLLSRGGPLRPDEIHMVTLFILNWKDTALGKVVLTELVIPPANPQDPATVGRGKEQFIAHCSNCHNYKGQMQPKVLGPDLTELHEVISKRLATAKPAEHIRESVLIPGEDIVPSFEPLSESHPCGAILSETELNAIIAFLLQ